MTLSSLLSDEQPIVLFIIRTTCSRCAIFKKGDPFTAGHQQPLAIMWKKCIQNEEDERAFLLRETYLFVKGILCSDPVLLPYGSYVNAHYTFCLEQYFYVRKTYPHALLMWCYTFCKREAQQQLFSVVQIGKMQHKKLERCRRPLFLLRTFDHFLLSLLPCHKIGLFSMSWHLSLY